MKKDLLLFGVSQEFFQSCCCSFELSIPRLFIMSEREREAKGCSIGRVTARTRYHNYADGDGDIITNMFDNGESLDVVYLDFRKAFDSVPHERLLIKLSAYGIEGELLQWIKGFLSQRTQRVRVGKSYSEETKVLNGIPQGSILGPVLFTIFINDLPDNICSNCKIYADDTKIYNNSNNKDILQADLYTLQQWSNT